MRKPFGLRLLAGVLLTLLSAGEPTWAAEERHKDAALQDLSVQTQSNGGVRATATLLFPGSPTVIQEILTDYPKWPELLKPGCEWRRSSNAMSVCSQNCTSRIPYCRENAGLCVSRSRCPAVGW
ncbi:MAG: hypothetical protein U0361_19035 [Nitrospiraceae bacterium]